MTSGIIGDWYLNRYKNKCKGVSFIVQEMIERFNSGGNIILSWILEEILETYIWRVKGEYVGKNEQLRVYFRYYYEYLGTHY